MDVEGPLERPVKDPLSDDIIDSLLAVRVVGFAQFPARGGPTDNREMHGRRAQQ